MKACIVLGPCAVVRGHFRTSLRLCVF